MSPVTLRYVVTASDHCTYEIPVQATSKADAINKAQRIYGFHGSFEEFEVADRSVRWDAKQMVEEAQS